MLKSKKKELPKILITQHENWDEWLESVNNVEDDWLKRKLVPSIQKLKQKISSIWKKEEEFSVKKEASSLKKFATQFVIQGKAGFAPRDFLNATKKVVVDLMNKNQNTKVKMALSCQMSRVDLTTGDVFTREATFHSLVEKNLLPLIEANCSTKCVKESLKTKPIFRQQKAIGDSLNLEI